VTHWEQSLASGEGLLGFREFLLRVAQALANKYLDRNFGMFQAA